MNFVPSNAGPVVFQVSRPNPKPLENQM